MTPKHKNKAMATTDRNHETDEEEAASLLPSQESEETRQRQNSIKHQIHNHNNSGKPKKKSHHQHHHNARRSSSTSRDTHERARRYLYSAISATFFFVLFRELGWIDQVQQAIVNADLQQYMTKDQTNNNEESTKYDSTQSLVSVAANMAGTSSMRLGAAGGRRGDHATELSAASAAANGPMGTDVQSGKLLGNSKNYGTRKEMMAHVQQEDPSIVPGTRPIMYTFFEWIPPRNRGTSMSDVADKALITEWKAAWKAAGWHPIVLTLEDSKKHVDYEKYVPQLSKIPMSGIVVFDGAAAGQGTTVYNQLCFLRWLAVAAAGGGWMSDYDVFPVAPIWEESSSVSTLPLVPPHNGTFTVFCRIKNSKSAGIPCLMSGRAEEWTRMAYALLDNGIKNANNGETMWSDMLALIDMRNEENMYRVYDAVLEGQEVLLKHGWTAADCNKTMTKAAVHFSHEALKLGYLPPGESAENRPEIIKRFLKSWHHLCGSIITAQDKQGQDVLFYGDIDKD